SAASSSSRMRLPAATKLRPVSVSARRRLERLRSCVFSIASSCATLRLTVVSGMPRRRDAAERLPASAAAISTAMESNRSNRSPGFRKIGFLIQTVLLKDGSPYLVACRRQEAIRRSSHGHDVALFERCRLHPGGQGDPGAQGLARGAGAARGG